MKYRNLYNIVFTDDSSVRWKRHFLFWLAVFFYHLLRIGIMMPAINSHNIWSLLERVTWHGVILNMIFTYLIVYIVVPKYFSKGKYGMFGMGLFIVFLLVDVLGLIHNSLLVPDNPVSNAIGAIHVARPFFWGPREIRLFGNPPLICCLFLSLKTLKSWHLEQLKTEMLEKENTSAEIQLLKAQVHPHFLFNTLNNIYSYSLNRSPQTGELVRKLSEMLGYMIHECDEKLEKELNLIQDYMGLEKVRYGKRLDMQVEIHGDFENKFIAPLLMIPFVENSFKHGTSQMLQHPWIKLEITTVKDQLFFKLSNSKPSLFHVSKQNKGIGLINVKKRLQLLYPGKHQLDVTETEDMFTVNMQILLGEKVFADNKIIDADKVLAYA
jgi:hypothetical protein